MSVSVLQQLGSFRFPLMFVYELPLRSKHSILPGFPASIPIPPTQTPIPNESDRNPYRQCPHIGYSGV